jgi:uncharacterized protein YbaA (DUF1428 family)
VSTTHSGRPHMRTHDAARKHTASNAILTMALLALVSTACLADDKPNPSDCAFQSTSTSKTAQESCTALWCAYYACTKEQGHKQCKALARAGIQACTAAKDPKFKLSQPIRP